jgi:four helix bundle protein
MNSRELRERVHQFSLDITKLCDELPVDGRTQDLAEQLHKAAHSADKNYRAACRARSHDEFVAKICIVDEEADEAEGWLQSLVDTGKADTAAAQRLLREATELASIFAVSKRTALANQAKRRASRARERGASARRHR